MNHLHWERGGFNPDAESAIRAMGTNSLPYLVEWIQRPNKPSSRDYSDPLKARIAFSFLGPEAKPAVPDLIKIIGRFDEHASPALVWDFPAQALVNIGKDAVPPLADKLMEMLANTNRQPETGGNLKPVNQTREGYNYGRLFAVLAAMGTNAEAAMPALIAVASSDLPMDEEMEISGMCENRFGALAMVGRNHPDAVAPVLVKKFVSSPTERGMIAKAMTVFGTNQSDAFLPVLLAAVSDNYTNEYASYTRTEIGDALSKIGHNQPDIVVPALLTIYTNCPLGWRVEVAGSLAAFGSRARSALPLLMADSLLENAPHDNRWRISLCLAAKTIAPDMPETMAPLLKDLDSSDQMIRVDTIQCLESYSDRGGNCAEVIPKLRQMETNDPDSNIRSDAGNILRFQTN
jgi:HEAT repeat protein